MYNGATGDPPRGGGPAGPSMDGTAGSPSGGAASVKTKLQSTPNFDFFPRRRKAPPPFKCSKGEELVYFFRTFERYVTREYSLDEEDWRLVLPEYLEGDLLRTVKSFKPHEQYHVIKARLLKDFASPARITGNNYSDLLDASRQPNESLNCFRIRLECMAEGLGVDDVGRRALIMKALERNTGTGILRDIKKLQVVMGDMDIEKYVELYNEFSKLEVSKSSNPVASLSADNATLAMKSDKYIYCSLCQREGHLANDCFSHSVVCYGCRQPGHIRRNCPQQADTQNFRIGLYCGFCGQPGHAMLNCTQYNDFEPREYRYDIGRRGRGMNSGFRGGYSGPRGGTNYRPPQRSWNGPSSGQDNVGEYGYNGRGQGRSPNFTPRGTNYSFRPPIYQNYRPSQSSSMVSNENGKEALN